VIPKLRRIIDNVLNDALKNGFGYGWSLTNFVDEVMVGADMIFDLRALV
jgi:hypothetical protein